MTWKKKSKARKAAAEPNPAVRLLLEMASEAGLTRHQLALRANVDDRYLARLESGEAVNPGRDIVLRLGVALVRYTSLFGRNNVERVLKAAGFPPSPEHLWTGLVWLMSPDEDRVEFLSRW